LRVLDYSDGAVELVKTEKMINSHTI
jgi:hypothetical protein